MNRLSNLHTHTSYSDGSSPLVDYIDEAIRQGFSVLGISDHSPIPIPNTFAIREGELKNYCDAVANLKNTTGGAPLLLLGLEYDYIPGLTVPLSDLRRDYPFDYIIGSVHLVNDRTPEPIWFIDGPDPASYDRGLQEVFGGDARRAVTAYWQQVQEMIATQQPDIIGHPDKIRMHNRNRFFMEQDDWYLRLVDETLDLIKESGCVVEVNTRGLYKKRSDTTFPSPVVLKRIKNLEIPVTVSSDAHKPAEISLLITETKKMLKEMGFGEQWMLDPGGWTREPLS